MSVMSDEEDEEGPFCEAADAAIEALQRAARLYRQYTTDELSIDTERWFACWLAQILSDVGIDLERGAQSLVDDGVTWVDGPFHINDPRPERSPDQTNGRKKL
jgi:hypothetical protein